MYRNGRLGFNSATKGRQKKNKHSLTATEIFGDRYILKC